MGNKHQKSKRVGERRIGIQTRIKKLNLSKKQHSQLSNAIDKLTETDKDERVNENNIETSKLENVPINATHDNFTVEVMGCMESENDFETSDSESVSTDFNDFPNFANSRQHSQLSNAIDKLTETDKYECVNENNIETSNLENVPINATHDNFTVEVMECMESENDFETSDSESVSTDSMHIRTQVENSTVESVEFLTESENDFDASDSENAQNHNLTVEFSNEQEKKSNIDLVGRRIVDPNFLFSQIKKIGLHEPFHCGFFDMDIIKECRKGFHVTWTFRCRMCHLIKTISSDDGSMDVTMSAVSGTILSGNGNVVLQKITSAMNIPPISTATYTNHANKIYNHLNEIAIEEMKAAAEEEKELAILRNDVDEDGVPFITVITDGAWCKRSYKNSYDSLGGVGVIVGAITKKVLYIGVLNKFCLRCAMAKNRNEPASPHTCFKNWDSGKSSCSMETEAIVDGFKCAEEMYGIRYRKIIADGDSSAYKKIKEFQPNVQKIECTNHLLRNFCNKLTQLCGSSSKYVKELVSLKKTISSKIVKWRTAIKSAILHRQKQTYSDDSINDLKMDIRNSISHIFGEHKKCKDLKYFCSGEKKPNECDLIPLLSRYKTELLDPIYDIMNRLVDNADSLLLNYNNNPAETYNSVCCMMIGGKRVNHTGGGGYQARNSAAVISYNTGTPFTKLHHAVTDQEPGLYSKLDEERRLTRKKNRPKMKKIVKSTNQSQPNSDYGPNVQRPDVSSNIYEEKRSEFLKNLIKTKEQIAMIESGTRDQSDNADWHAERRNRITASNFGTICRMRQTTNSACTVNKLLYSTFTSQAMVEGKINEPRAIEQLEQETGLKIEKSGFFIHRRDHFLGASPDGLIGRKGLVEVKCPQYKEPVNNEDITYGEITNKTLWRKHEVNEKHHHFYQVQGQLEVTNRSYCLYYVWTPHGTALTKIERDKKFWRREMFPKLRQFYWNCLLPELVDPRCERGMSLRKVTINGDNLEDADE